jgi:hypothetical protein
MFGGSGPQNIPPPTPAYQYAGLPGADSALLGLIGGQAGNVPQVTNITQGLVNNPYAAMALAGGRQAAPEGQVAGATQMGAGYGLVGSGLSNLPYAQQALMSGFDPQSQVYNTLFQQNTDQTRAAEAARGIDMTPYGVGVEAQSNIGFNTAWQQQLQLRQAQAAQTAAQLQGSAGTTTGVGLGDITGGIGTQYSTAQLPWSTFQNIGQTQLQDIGAGQGIAQTPISNYLTYLGQGTQAAQAGTQQYMAALAAQQSQFQQQQAYGKGIGSGLQSMGTALGAKPGQSYVGSLFS